jgi:hypothetical protein
MRVGGIDKKQAQQIINDATDAPHSVTKTWLETAQSAFSREANVRLAEDVGIEKFEYVGPLDGITRPFCEKHVGEVKTIEGWDKLDNGQISPVSVFCGGYRCRHKLVGVE